MKYIAVALSALAIGWVTAQAASADTDCRVGRAYAYVAMNPKPFLIGTLPRNTTNPLYYKARYNCVHETIYARRLDEGIFEVVIPGVNRPTALVSASSQEGLAASVYRIGKSTYRITIRGPGQNLRDVAFNLVVF